MFARSLGRVESALLCLFLAMCSLAFAATVSVDRASSAIISTTYKASWIPLPTNADPPLCASNGHRIKVVYDGSGVASPAIVSELRSIVNRMNWKIRSQALASSTNAVPLEMKVECDASGQPRIYSQLTGDRYTEFGRPKGAQAIKYLVFVDETAANGGNADAKAGDGKGDSRYWTKSLSDEPVPPTGVTPVNQSNYSRVETQSAKVYRENSEGSVNYWNSHVTIHELFHSFGAVQLGPSGDQAPASTPDGHCTDNIDLLCGVILDTSHPCQPGQGSPAYDSPAGVPLDCQYDTYFDAAPESGEWLSRHWNTGGPENPFLANPNTYVPEPKRGLEFDLASSATNRLDLAVLSPDSSLRYRARTNGTWGTWTFLGGSLASAPVLISPEAGRLDVFACSYDGTVAHRTYLAGSWGGWQSLGAGGSGCGGLDAVSWGPGRIDLFVRDGSAIFHRAKSGETWTGWGQIAGAADFSVNSLPTAASRKSGELHVFVRNGSSDIRVRVFANNAWGAWTSISSPNSGAIGVPEAVQSANPNQPMGTAHVFARGYNQAAWGRTLFNGGMSLWRNHGGDLGASAVAAVARPMQELDLYMVDAWGKLQTRHDVHDMSTAWQGLGGDFRATRLEAVAIETGGAWLNAVAAIGDDGKLYVGDDGAAGWSGWQQVEWPTDVSEHDAFDVPNGQTWQLRPTPVPNPMAITRLVAVSCSTPDACMAVGHYGGEYAHALRWDGHRWLPASVPLPTGAKASTLRGVSCTSPSHCAAAGHYKDSSGAWLPWVVRWNGSTWSSQTMPSVSGNAFLSAISCTATDVCTAVGNHVEAEDEPLVLRLPAEGSWEQVTLVGPSGNAVLNGVSCVSTGDCRAVGYFHDGTGWRALAAHGNEATWGLQPITHPTGLQLAHLYGVSCTAADACTAVGIKHGAVNSPETLAMRWNGTAWTLQETPSPGHPQSRLLGVSCVSASLCVAVGSDSLPDGTESSLALRWDGSGWTVEQPPDPGGTMSYLGLYGVSCTHPTACTAAGWHRVSVSEFHPLVARLQGGPPRVTPHQPVGVAKGQATLKGWINPNGLETEYQIEWGPTTAYGNSVPAAPTLVGSGRVDAQVEHQISGLVGEQTYHYRIVAKNAEGTTGPDQQFTTPMWKPSVTVHPVIGIEAGGAVLHGTVNPNGFATTYQFEWGTTTAYGNSVPVSPGSVGSGVDAKQLTVGISGLTGEKTYHYRVKATNSEGTSYSGDQTFVTPNFRPQVTTDAASEVFPQSATLNGTVNPNGFATTYQFQYGPTEAYGSTVPATPESAGSGASGHPVQFEATGLEPFTTYNYRVVATSAEGTSYGENRVFETHPAYFWTEYEGATLAGEDTGPHVITTGSLELTCDNVAYSGFRELTEGKTITVIPSYGSCASDLGWVAGTATADPGGCEYELHVDGTMSIVGSTCDSDPLTFSATFFGYHCEVAIGPQALGKVSYENLGGGEERVVAASTDLASLEYTMSGPICPKQGFSADGSYVGESLLRATGYSEEPYGLWLE